MNHHPLATLCAVGLGLLGLAGCARFSVTQIDESPNERTITTRISGTAFFSSAQTVSKIKAVQTDKTQSFGTDALGQHGATNVAETVDLPAEASAQAGALTRLVQSLRPTP